MSEINSLLTFANNSNDDTLTYFNMSFISRIKDNADFIEVSKSVIDDYLPELKALAVTITLSDLEFANYAYKPELLSYYLYGSTELYFIILLLNGMTSPKDFNVKKLKLLDAATCLSSLTTIYNSEEEVIRKKLTVEREEE